jgi:hypothetical protein
MACGGGLWARGHHQAGVSAGALRRLAVCGALHRPHRQRHPRLAARCADRRHHPARSARASFGLRQSLDTIGAFIGPLLAIGLMLLTADNFTLVFWFAVIPAFLSFAVIVFACKSQSAC